MVTLLKNRYRILRSLNSGGFGETFLAEDTDMPSARRCVIKKLIPITNEPQIYQIVKERFGREAVILEKLGEGNSCIPSLYAYFEENGQFYLIQEWIEGTTLNEKIEREGILVESSVREILMNILSVLDFVHSQYIVHRDIKPENIIIRASDNKPVLIDFGAVKETMGTFVTNSGRNSNSIIIGTPGFMPSEQSIGRPVYSSDLYSLGLTAIYLLIGKYPQEFATHPTTGEILWRKDAAWVSPALAEILDKAIQSHPRDRFSSAKEMLDALQKVTPIGVNFSNASQAATIVYPKSTIVEKPANTSQINSSGLADWGKAVITGSIVGCFMMGALVLNSYLTRSSYSQQTVAQPTSESPNQQEYRLLEELLQKQDFQRADAETDALIINSLQTGSKISSLPCDKLAQIDRLWIKSSKGRFGYSQQLKTWRATKQEFSNDSYNRFANRIGWYENGTWLFPPNLVFDMSAKIGHLPWHSWQVKKVRYGFEEFMNKLDNCQLNVDKPIAKD
jgi:serine/threonine protein kinase, bacterial